MREARLRDFVLALALGAIANVHLACSTAENGANEGGGTGGSVDSSGGGGGESRGAGSNGEARNGGSAGGKGGTPVASQGGSGTAGSGSGGAAASLDAGLPNADAAVEPNPKGTPVLVAVGDHSRRICSFDGATWGQQSTADAPSDQENGLTGLAMGKGAILAAGESGGYTTTDCKTWKKIVSPTIATGFPFQHPGAAYGNGRFVIISHGESWWSEDLVNWHIVYNTGDATHWRMVFGKDRFVAVGDANSEGGRRKWSTDGVVWKDYQTGGDAFWNIAYGNNYFVGVGAHDLRARSLDGVTWESRVDTGQLGDFGAIAFGDGKFLACTYVNCVSSTDGAAWSAPLKQRPGGNYAIGFGFGTWIIATDKIYSSKTWATWSPLEATKGAAFARLAFGYLGQ